MERSRYTSKILMFLLLLALLINRAHIFFSISGQLLNNYSDFLYISLFFSDLVILVVFLILTIIMKTSILDYISKKSILPWIIGYFIANCLITPRETLYSYYFIAKILLILALIWSISDLFFRTKDKREGFLLVYKFFSIAGIAETLIATLQFFRQKSIGLSFLGETYLSLSSGIAKIDTEAGKFIRPYGTFAHPNILAAFLVVACATSLILSLSTSKIQRTMGAVSLFINIFGVFLSFSRSGILAAFLVLSLILILYYSKREVRFRNLLKISFFTIIVFILSASVLSRYLVSRATISDASTVNRITYDKIGLKIFLEHPLFGVGLGNVVPEVGKSGNFEQTWQIQPPHNYFLLVADETGIVGLILILILFYTLLKKLWKNTSIQEEGVGEFNIFLFAVFIGIIFLMQFDHYFYDLEQGQLLLWIIVGIIISQTRAYNLVAE